MRKLALALLLCAISTSAQGFGGKAGMGGKAGFGGGATAGQTITVVQTAPLVTSGTTIVFSSNITAGNCVVATFAASPQPTGVTGSTDTYTKLAQSSDASGDWSNIYRIANSVGGYTTLSIAGGITDLTGSAIELAGAGSSCALDGSAVQLNTQGPAATTGSNLSITPSVSGDIFIGCANNENGGAMTLTTGTFTSIFNSAIGETGAAAYLISTDSAAHTVTWTFASSTWNGVMVAIKHG